MHHPGRSRAGRHLSAGLAALLCTASASSATTLRKMDLPEIVALADRVVHARAVAGSVYWDEEGTRIYTDTTFEVLEEAKGQGPSALTVTLLGGRIDPIEMREEGAPVFATGEEVVLFALQRPDGRNDLVGFSQGVLRVQPEPETMEKFAVSEVPLGVLFVQPGEPAPAAVRPSPLRAPLASLLDEVRQMVAGTRQPGPILATSPDTDLLGAEGGNP